MSRALRREEGLDEQGTSSGIAGEHVLLNAYEHSAGIILAVGSFLSISRHVEYHRALAVLLVFCTDVVLREERSAALLLQAIARPKACKFSSECGSTNHASSLPHRRKGQTPSVVLFVDVSRNTEISDECFGFRCCERHCRLVDTSVSDSASEHCKRFRCSQGLELNKVVMLRLSRRGRARLILSTSDATLAWLQHHSQGIAPLQAGVL